MRFCPKVSYHQIWPEKEKAKWSRTKVSLEVSQELILESENSGTIFFFLVSKKLNQFKDKVLMMIFPEKISNQTCTHW